MDLLSCYGHIKIKCDEYKQWFGSLDPGSFIINQGKLFSPALSNQKPASHCCILLFFSSWILSMTIQSDSSGYHGEISGFVG
jgi:hypothetical protein